MFTIEYHFNSIHAGWVDPTLIAIHRSSCCSNHRFCPLGLGIESPSLQMFLGAVCALLAPGLIYGPEMRIGTCRAGSGEPQ